MMIHRLTYDELNRRSNQVAHYLRSLKVGPEMRVAVCLPRSIEMLVATIGILKSGAAYVPLDSSSPRERLRDMLADADPSVVLVERRMAMVAADGISIVPLDELRGEIARFPDSHVDVDLCEDHLAYMIYTSGSTGKPKGVMVPHRAILNRLLWMKHLYGWGTDTTVLQKTPTVFDASIWELFVPLLSGGRTVLAEHDGQRDPERMAQRIADEGVTVLQLVPSAVPAFLSHGMAARGHVTHLFCGGEALPSAVARSARDRLDVRVTNLYGPTEAAIDVTWCDDADRETAMQVPIGRPIANTRAYVLDRNLQPVPIGVAGELYISGAGLARGYWRQPQLTAERFVPDPYASAPGTRMYSTGDRARFRETGTIEFIGRTDAQVKIRGFRIELEEIEAVLSRHPDVHTAVASTWHGDGETELVAYVVPAAGVDASASRLKEWLAAHLPPYMVPSSFLTLDAIPITASGKLDRRRLRPPVRAADATTDAWLPRTLMERMVAEVCADVLHRDAIGMHEDFFDAGGHSLSMFRLIARLERMFGIRIPVQRIYQSATAARLTETVSEYLRKVDAPSRPAVLRIADDDPRPLSFAQERLWFIHRLDPGSRAYDLQTAIPLESDVDVHHVRAALTHVVQRHQLLRTIFVERDGVPAQVVMPESEAALEQITVSAGSSAMTNDGPASFAPPFDLGSQPPLRAALVHHGSDQLVLLLMLHHIVADAWSIALLVREIREIVAALSAGRAPALPALPVQYSDWAACQRNWLQGTVLQTQLEYWTDRLAGVPIVTLMPDRPRPPARTYRGTVEVVQLPADVALAARNLGRQASATMFMTLLAAFKLTLMRMGAGEDVVVGTHVANRDCVEVEHLIGCFVNSLVMRTRVPPTLTFRALLERVRETVVGALAHQDLPFERLVEHLQPSRELSVTPLYQMSFDYEHADDRSPAVGGAASRAQESTAKFDISVTIRECRGDLEIVAAYSTDLYERATIERLLRRYVRILAAVTAYPEQQIGDLDVMDPEERARVLAQSRGRRVEYPIASTLSQHVEARAAEAPDRIAAVSDGISLTYRDVNGMANQVARALRESGVRPGHPVILFAPRDLAFLVGALGVVKAGAAYVPVDPDYPDDRTHYMIRNCRAATLLTIGALAPSVQRFVADSSSVRHVVLLDDDAAHECTSVATGACVWSARDRWVKLSAENLEAGLQHPAQPAYVLYTSGSTGRPKAAIVPHDGAVNHIFAQRDELELDADIVFLQSAPSSSDISVWQMFAPLVLGGRTVFVDAETVTDPPRLLDVLQRERITIIECVPVVLRCLIDYVAGLPAEQLALPELRCVMAVGEEVPISLINDWVERYPGVLVVDAYGPTEASDDVAQSMTRQPLPPATAMASIGTPLPNVDCLILDDQLRLVPIGVPGELCVAGVAVGDGYLHAPRHTASSFVPDPFSDAPGERLYRTGDVCRWINDGTLRFLGRRDQQVKIRGFRVELGEIEAAVRAYPGVRNCAVLIGEGASGKELRAYYVPAGNAPISSKQLWDFVATRLPAHMVPSSFAAVEGLSLGPAGKVDRDALERIPTEKPGSERDAVPVRTRHERLIAEVWADVLHVDVDKMGAHADFFEWGGYSLLGTRVVARVRDRLGVKLSLRCIFELSTIERLAAHVATLEESRPIETTPTLRRVARSPAKPVPAPPHATVDDGSAVSDL